MYLLVKAANPHPIKKERQIISSLRGEGKRGGYSPSPNETNQPPIAPGHQAHPFTTASIQRANINVSRPSILFCQVFGCLRVSITFGAGVRRSPSKRVQTPSLNRPAPILYPRADPMTQDCTKIFRPAQWMIGCGEEGRDRFEEGACEGVGCG